MYNHNIFPIKMATQTTHLSQYFGVPHAEFVKHGVYDALLGEDSRLHIDPLLIRTILKSK